MTKVALVVITDGRGEYLEQCLQSLLEHVDYPFDYRIMVDDSGDSEYASWLAGRWHGYRLVSSPQRRGLAGAVNAAWSRIPADTDFVFHVEEDFVFDKAVPVDRMRALLEAQPHLVQMCLLRPPWSAQELLAGSIVELSPSSYTPRAAGGVSWLEHIRFFSLNPCLYPRWVTERGWPAGNEAEFTARLFEDPDLRSGYWGDSHTYLCHHIGFRRSPGWTP